jgi:hypothetical protein
VRSIEGRDRGGAGLRAFVEEAEKQGPTSVIVFAPPSPGEWIDRLLDLARERRVHVVIGTDGAAAGARPPQWRRLLFRDRPATGGHAGRLLEVMRRLGQPGCRLTVLDRETGQPLGEMQLQRLCC